jgi:hypothetical protein
MADTAKPLFKKRKQKGNGVRKSQATEEVDNDVDDDAEQIRLISELREEQKERQRKAGVDSTKLLAASQEAINRKEQEAANALKNVQEELAGPNLKAIMTNQFTEQVGLTQSDDKVHLKRMEAYIDEKMGISSQNQGSQDNKDVKVMSEEDKLFLINDPNQTTKVDEGSTGIAAPLFMNTGLAEVTLPISFKLKNIQRTEEAKAELGYQRSQKKQRSLIEDPNDEDINTLDPQPTTKSGRYGGAAAITGGSFNSNFNTHRREYAASMKNDKRFQQQSTGGDQRGEIGGRSATSDDRCFDQYRKHSRR